VTGRESRGTPAPDDDFWYMPAARAAAAGISVTPEIALQCSPVNACIDRIGGDLSTLPLPLYEMTGNGVPERVTDWPAPLLKYRANPETLASQLRRQWWVDQSLYGTAYCHVERSKGGRVQALWRLLPQHTTPTRRRDTGEIYYAYRPGGGEDRDYKFDEVLRIPWMGLDGVTGLAPALAGKEVIGLALAVESFGARFFANDATSGLVLETDTLLGEEAIKHLKGSFPAGHMNAHKIKVLEEGLKLKEYGVDPEKAQALELQEFCIPQVARYWGMQPALIQDHKRSTFSNVYGQLESHVKFCLRPKAVFSEVELNEALLGPAARGQLYFEHNFEGMLRAEIKARGDWYAQMLQNGVYSVNEVRKIENMPPVDGGDAHQTQVNMADIASDDVTGDGDDGNDDADQG
jgi:HK97 family phage portal protein